ncbi:MAG TPA: 4Fe-4S dicluster domain-containing protein [bacterium]|nr:4Fe-4S dicluster domain-containing protein [bacterium]HQI50035.1 4Fe-4S dicluster domain-containing protein [bacterium]HQJ63856.1 4Fe-4S dicluster domain-containing protein [bacterium]
MDVLRTRARELLESGTVQIVIGFGQGSNGRSRALFVQTSQAAENLIWDDTCQQNLATYLFKPEVRQKGKVAIVAPLPVLRSVLQLASENQVQDGDLVVLGVNNGELTEMTTLQEMEAAVSTRDLTLKGADLTRLQELDAMSLKERWQFWQEELARCFKCYACRAACPMCYCSRCTVECNQPQWIPVPAHQLGNWEWHMMRAMHLAGRCVSCGACGRACPLDIPIHLLTIKMEESIFQEFGIRAGVRAKAENALSSFRAEDKEQFII